MTAPFLALITPLTQAPGEPTHPIVTPPPYPDQGLPGPQPTPTPPIYYPPYPDQGLPPIQGQPPLGIWGPPQMPPGFWGGGMGPGVKPQPPQGGQPGVPTHPIYNPPYPDQGLPGPQPTPTPPIYFPPEGGQPPLGIWGPPDMPPGFWGGGMGPGVKPQPPAPPKPTHPIVLPPNLPPVIPPEGERPETPIEWKTAWTPQTGWIVVGIPTVPVPTPS